MSTLFRIINRSYLSLVWSQMYVQFNMRALSLFSFILLIVQPAIFSGIGYILARIAGNQTPDLIHVILGGGIMGLWSSLVFTSFFDISSDRRDGTLELIIGSPTSLLNLLAIRMLTNILTGTISIVLSFLVLIMTFHYSLPANNFFAICISFFLMFFSFWCMGLLLAHFQAWSRLTGMFINFLELPVAILSAFMFPREYLPGWILWLSDIIPVRWAVTAVKISFQTKLEIRSLYIYWFLSLATSLIYLLITLFLSNRVHRMIRITGELSSV